MTGCMVFILKYVKKKKAKEKIFGYKQVGEILDIIESGL